MIFEQVKDVKIGIEVSYFFKEVKIAHFWFFWGHRSAVMKIRAGVTERVGLCPMSLLPSQRALKQI